MHGMIAMLHNIPFGKLGSFGVQGSAMQRCSPAVHLLLVDT